MKTLLIVTQIITKFVNCITVGVRIASMLLLFVQPSTYNQREVIPTATVYKGSYDNAQPLCTNSHKVKGGLFQKQIISFIRSPYQRYYICLLLTLLCLNSLLER